MSWEQPRFSERSRRGGFPRYIRGKISAADRSPLEDDVRRSVLDGFLKTPLSEMDAREVRTEGNLKRVFRDFATRKNEKGVK